MSGDIKNGTAFPKGAALTKQTVVVAILIGNLEKFFLKKSEKAYRRRRIEERLDSLIFSIFNVEKLR